MQLGGKPALAAPKRFTDPLDRALTPRWRRQRAGKRAPRWRPRNAGPSRGVPGIGLSLQVPEYSVEHAGLTPAVESA
jgi:hypothetical protein